jgi:hypothetical protein
MHRRHTAAFVAVLLLTFAGGCTEPASPPDTLNLPVSLIVISGGNQTALEFTELPQPIVVQLVNAKGRGVGGQIVNFRAVQGGGSVWAGASVTDNKGFAKDWWTLGTADLRNLLEARVIDPATGAQLVLGTVVVTPQRLINPIVQFQCGSQTTWTPPNTGPLPGECYGTAPEVPSYPNSTAIPVRVRVIHNGTVPVPNMWLDFFASHNTDTGTPPSVSPVYGRTDALGMATTTFTTGSRLVLNELLVAGPNGIQGYQDFTAGY